MDGIDTTAYPVLSGLARLGPTTATQLAATIGVDRTVTTRYASRLEAAGLLSSAVDDILASWPATESAPFARLLERFTDLLENPNQ